MRPASVQVVQRSMTLLVALSALQSGAQELPPLIGGELAAVNKAPVNIVPLSAMPRPASITELLKATKITCDFGPGAAALHLEDVPQFASPTSWQGGPIVFDLLDVHAGTARMSGNAGVVGTVKGEVDVRLVTSNARLHFLGLLPNGELVVTTVFDAVDTSGRYIALMSKHAGPGGAIIDFGWQQIGACL